MKITIRGKAWDFRYVKRVPKDCVAHCDDPTVKAKRIRVLSSLRDEERLDATIHEALHAAHWDLSEEAINATATDLARLLWKLGYRQETNV